MMISEEHRKICSIAGFVYWEEFFQNRRGNPWNTKPTKTMLSSYSVYSLSKKSAITYEITFNEVLFDEHYVTAWLKHTFEGVEFLAFQDAINTDIQDKFAEFEAISDIVLSVKNPRHSLYLKFQEFIHNAN